MARVDTMHDVDARTLTKELELSFDRVVKRYPTGTTALDGIDLRVRRGDFVAVVGPSGCGKSTLLRLAAGLESPTSGSVAVGTESLGFIFQEPTLLPWRSVRRNVELCVELRHLDKATRRARADSALAAVGLSDFADQLPKTLSGGMKMRASLARALTLAPEVLLLDEPFGALDEMTRLDMQVELLRLYTERRFTAMFITHSVSEAVFLANRVVAMTARPGRIAGVLDIDLPYPRGPELRYTPQFTAHVARISALLQGESR
ncbi:ABC transporter ATP-binding protein [Nocardia sp. alder85J]|uniref:ABC transporter ATP-binding protein n=1 Tax=Nocardia sp. alder85J TaxID=2862949 RepID=UPI001CD6EE15|nr:ABC transporter ATP-binding protein [Nocardia sp. alder85J]MCX4091477.1 ABC transporter ATP-binding protein [Nocardia sp. alder85J]